MEKIIVDAMDQPCPLPVVKATKALQERKNNEILEIHVDNQIAVENVRRMAENKGLSVKCETLDAAHFLLTLSGASQEQENCACTTDTVVAIGSATMGSGDDALGKILMKGFLYALSQQEILPKTILFYNGGATIPVDGSVSVEDLKAMQAQGVKIFTCGTCLDFYGLKETLAVGEVTNMYSIVEMLSKASHIIKP